MKPTATLAIVMAVLFLTLMPVGAQAPASATKSWAPPRTADGRPDLQGTWNYATITPLERPADLKDKPFFTQQEAAAYEKRALQAADVDQNRQTTVRGIVNGTAETTDLASAYNEFWWDRGTKVVKTRRTSLIVDPADGRIPPLTPQAKRRLSVLAEARERTADGPEDRSLSERCIMRPNAGPPMMPGGYNNYIQVIQTPQFITILNEQIHDARIIPLDGRPHVPSHIREYMGDSRGQWEGDTLVVDTTNFTDKTTFRGSGEKMHLIERFTRTAPDTLLYEYTVDDPESFSSRWTAQIPMTITEDLIYEYACHEANYGMTGTLKGARMVEKLGPQNVKTPSR